MCDGLYQISLGQFNGIRALDSRHKFIFKSTQKQDWDLGDFRQPVLALPGLVAEAC